MIPENVPAYLRDMMDADWRQQHRPRVHGNGFIQIDIDDRRRLHVWGHPDIPRQRVASPIHDHLFDFTSETLVGRLVNVVYGTLLDAQGEFEIFEPSIRQGEDTVLAGTGRRINVYVSKTQMLSAHRLSRPSSYRMERHVFHETFAPEPTITVMLKSGPTQAQGATGKPRVLVPFGVEPDNEFDRYACAAPSELWRIFDEVMWP